jgi:HlyD family secretion protein
VPKASLEMIGDKKLMPGMPAEVIIKTGSRTALDYIINPITVSMNRAWREE